jgi:uncharacterized DUF497 family protein
VKFTYDATKDRRNVRKHGISLQRVAEFDFNSAVFFPDVSQDYGEPRELALGFLAGTLYMLVFIQHTDLHVHVISLRRATAQEETVYAAH